MWTEQSERFMGSAPVHAHRQPSQALARIDKIKNGHKILIGVWRVAWGGIGDVLMTLPTVKAIKKKYNCELHYITNFDYLDGALPKVLIGNPYIDQVVDYQKVKDKEQYDALVDLTCPCIAYEKPRVAPLNRIDIFARHAGADLQGDFKIDYYIQEDERNWARGKLIEWGIANRRIILVQPNSSTKVRDLPPQKLQKAIASILSTDHRLCAVILAHGKKAIDDITWSYANCLEARDLDVRQIVALMELSELVMCQDSAVLHLAGAIEKKTLSFFGHTDARARVNHYKDSVAIAYGVDLACAYCWWEPSCNNAYYCWKKHDESFIAEIATLMLNNQPLPNSPYLIKGV